MNEYQSKPLNHSVDEAEACIRKFFEEFGNFSVRAASDAMERMGEHEVNQLITMLERSRDIPRRYGPTYGTKQP